MHGVRRADLDRGPKEAGEDSADCRSQVRSLKLLHKQSLQEPHLTTFLKTKEELNALLYQKTTQRLG